MAPLQVPASLEVAAASVPQPKESQAAEPERAKPLTSQPEALQALQDQVQGAERGWKDRSTSSSSSSSSSRPVVRAAKAKAKAKVAVKSKAKAKAGASGPVVRAAKAKAKAKVAVKSKAKAKAKTSETYSSSSSDDESQGLKPKEAGLRKAAAQATKAAVAAKQKDCVFKHPEGYRRVGGLAAQAWCVPGEPQVVKIPPQISQFHSSQPHSRHSQSPKLFPLLESLMAFTWELAQTSMEVKKVTCGRFGI
eukprot:s828_g11.t2